MNNVCFYFVFLLNNVSLPKFLALFFMKRAILIFLLIGIVACGKNDSSTDIGKNDNNTNIPNPFIGIWQLEEEIEQGEVVGKSQLCFYLRTLTFGENTITRRSYSSDCELTTLVSNYKFKNNIIEIVNEKGETIGTVSPTIEGNKLTFNNTVKGKDGNDVVLISVYRKVDKLPEPETAFQQSLLGKWFLHSEMIGGKEGTSPCLTKTEIIFTEKQITTVSYEGENCNDKAEIVADYTINGRTINTREVAIEIQGLTDETLVLGVETHNPRKIRILTCGRTQK